MSLVRIDIFNRCGNFPDVLVNFRLRWVGLLKQHEKLGVHRPAVCVSYALDTLPHAVGDTDDNFIQETAGTLIGHASVHTSAT